ncbi:MAG: cytochrome c [Thermonemataceae bacterium]|nr:cytochrome c [Thermonemataceae bacterium]
MKIYRHILSLFLGASSLLLVSCERGNEDPGTEFSPNMYVSLAYDPYSQVADSANKINPMGLNMRNSAKGTVARRNYATTYTDASGKTYDMGLMVYNIHKDSLEQASRILLNPVPANKETLAEGKELYGYYCQHCHGEGGKGDGLVGQKYGGVANLTGGAIAKVNGGHIFHVITHGKGRMWAHASQMNALERWKIVNYVHTLQGQINPDGTAIAKDTTQKK